MTLVECPFLVPRIAVGTYGLASVRSSVRPSVRPSVRERSQNPFIGIFWFLAESWGFLMRRKWRFRILVEKSRFGVFGPFMSKNGHFWPKINILANISKSGHRIFLVLYIWTLFWVYLWNHLVKVPGKILFWPFWPFFGQKWSILVKNQGFG